MKTPRKDISGSGAVGSKARGGRQPQGARPSNKRETPKVADQQRNTSKTADLPPNKNIRKYPDEIYGDTEIPDRKKDS
jgi:hypothetical protein